MLSLPPAFFLWHTTVFWWVSGSISWPTAFTDMWDNVVWSPWPSCYLFVSTEVRAPVQWLRWPLTVFCPCARLDGGSVWIWKQKSHAQEPVGSHLTENIISLQSCWCCGSQMLSLLEGLWERQENWIQPGAKIREPQGTDFSQKMLSPLWSHKAPCLNSEGSCTKRTESLWEFPSLMPALAFPNLPPSPNHSLLERYFHLLFKTWRFLICRVLVSRSICNNLYHSYLGFCCNDPMPVNSCLPHLTIFKKFERLWLLNKSVLDELESHSAAGKALKIWASSLPPGRYV